VKQGGFGVARERLSVLAVMPAAGENEWFAGGISDAEKCGLELTIIPTVAAAEERLHSGSFDVALLFWDFSEQASPAGSDWVHRSSDQIAIVVLVQAWEAALARDLLQAGAQDVLPRQDLSAGGLFRALLHAAQRHRRIAPLAAAEVERRRWFDDSLDLLCIADFDGHLKRVNPAFDALEYAEEELLGRPFLDFVHPGDRAAVLQQLEKLGQGVDVEHFPCRMILKDGRVRRSEWTCRAPRQGDRGLYAAGRDVTDRAEMEARHQGREKEFRNVLDSLPFCICVIDEQAAIRTVNRAWRAFARENQSLPHPTDFVGENYLGAAESALGTSEHQDAQRTIDGIRQLLSTQQGSFELEYPCHSSTELRWFRLHAFPLCGENTGVVIVHEDITRQKMAEIASEESDARYRSLAHDTNAVPWEVDAETMNFTFVGAQAARVFGFPPEEWQRPNFWEEHLHEQDREWVPGYCAGRVQTQSDFQFDYRMVSATGKVIWVHDVVHVKRNEKGQPYKLSGYLIDITERKHAEQKLQASEQRYRTVVDAAGEAIVRISTRGIAETWNPAAQNQFGYTAAEMIGTNVARLVPPHLLSEFARILSKLQEGRSILGWETQRLTKDGRLLDVVLNLAPIRNEEGTVIGGAASVRDVTEYKRAREELRRRTEQLAHLTRVASMGEMATWLAHELSQPVGAAANYADGCARLVEAGSTPPADLLAKLRLLRECISESARIIRGLKSFLSKTEPRKVRCDLHALISEVDGLVLAW